MCKRVKPREVYQVETPHYSNHASRKSDAQYGSLFKTYDACLSKITRDIIGENFG
jgi:hypothetical protein